MDDIEMFIFTLKFTNQLETIRTTRGNSKKKMWEMVEDPISLTY